MYQFYLKKIEKGYVFIFFVKMNIEDVSNAFDNLKIDEIPRQYITDIYEKCLLIINKEYILPVTKNKGKPGLYLEELLGIPQSSECLDCIDGELKTFPVKKLKNGKFVPKETIAITMLNKEELHNSFILSKCYKKMSKMLIVPYYRVGETIIYMMPKIISKDLKEYVELYKTLETDYDTIRKSYQEDKLTASTGTLLQNRTKGPGHGSISRAFYLRPVFMKTYVL